MNLIDLFKKAITGGEWFVAYREPGSEWKIARTPESQWCADPFTFQDGDNNYIFVEQYLKEKDKGCIGYFKFFDGIPINQGIILENSYHMSYPDVFRYKDKFYMIPETSANNTVDLYVAERFPDKWRKEITLIRGEKLVDTTVYEDKGCFFLISYKLSCNEVRVYSLDMEIKEVELISKKKYKTNVGRPGGRIFWEDGRLLRPAQDCSRKYGEALIIYQIDYLNKAGEFVEHEVRRIEVSNFCFIEKADRVHQFCSDGIYEVVDIYKERINLFHIPQILIRSMRK